jgi:hypothetical protein
MSPGETEQPKMPLPKELASKFKTRLKSKLKEGESLNDDDFDDFEHVVVFDNEAQFLEAAEKRAKPKLNEAEREKAKAIKDAKEAAAKEILGKLGNIDAEKLEELAAEIASMGETRTEHDKLKAAHDKLEKESKKTILQLTAERDGLLGFKVQHVKSKALEPHLAKIHPEMRDIVAENIMGKLSIGEKDAVTGPEGKAIDAFVDDLIKAKPSLKAPEFKTGGGTGPSGGKTEGGSNGTSGDDKSKQNGGGNGAGGGDVDQFKDLPIEQRLQATVAHQLRANAEAQRAAAAGTGGNGP